MAESRQIHRDMTREVFLEQARARLSEVRELEVKVRERVDDSPEEMRADVRACNVDVDMFISLAEVEIDCLEHAEEDEWIALRSRVDTAIGNAMGELDRCEAILDRPPEHVQWK